MSNTHQASPLTDNSPMLTLVQPCVLRDAFLYHFGLFVSGSKLCYQVFLDFGKANIGDLLAVRTENNISYDKPR